LFSRSFFNLRDPLANLFALVFAGIFLFVLIEQEKQVNVPSDLQIEIQATVAPALAFAAAWIGDTCFANASQSGNHRPSLRILSELRLNRPEKAIRAVASQLVKPPRKRAGLDEFHIVIVPQCGMRGQRRNTQTPI